MKTLTKSGKLSAIIVNYNGSQYLHNCIKSIFHNDYKNVEVIIVDNNSSDNSVKNISKKFTKYIDKKRLKIIRLDANYGPAYARNVGFESSNGKYIAFLDNDTTVDNKWATTAIRHFDSNPDTGIIQSKLLLSEDKNRIDYVGEYLGQYGFLIQKADPGKEDKGQYDQIEPILAAKSAGMFIRRDTFIKAGRFDPDYFIYLEETDLGWRSWLSGYKNIYLPDSIVYHLSGTSVLSLGSEKVNYNTKFHGTKNYIQTLIKNLSTKQLFLILPVHIMMWLGLALYRLFLLKFKDSKFILSGILWNILHIKKTLTKRKHIQKKRTINDVALFRIVMKNRPISYYIKKATISRKIGNASSF